MKKLLLLLVLIQQGLILKANHNRVDFFLNMYDNSKFTIVFDDMYLGSACSEQSIQDVKPGYHFLQVFKQNVYHYGYGHTQQMIFHGQVDIPNASKVFAFIDHFGRFRIREIYPALPQVNSFNGHSGQYVHHAQQQFQHPVYYNNPPVFYGPVAMHPAEFEELVRVIDSKSFDSTKMNIAKQALAANKMNTAQVVRLVNLFTFESYKLEIAKFAYQHTLDKHKYHLVYDAFSFNSSVNNLISYINQQGSFGG